MTEQLTEQYAEVQEEVPSGPPAPVRIAWAPIARVNLLPIEIIESRRFRRTQLALAGTVVGALVLAGAGTYWAQHGVDQAKDDLNASQATVLTLLTEQAKYAAVPEVIAQVDAAVSARYQAMSTDVLFYRYLNDLDGARPQGVNFASMTISVPVATTTTPAVSNNPLVAAGIGTVTIDGTADQYSQVSAWMESLNKITGIASPTLASASKSEQDLSYSTEAVVNTDALSGRYEKKAG